jgi:hypothetical protein
LVCGGEKQNKLSNVWCFTKIQIQRSKKKKRFLAALEFILKRNPTQISSTKQQSSTDLTQAFDRTSIKIGSFVNLQKPMKNSFLLQQYDDGNF